MKNKLFILLFLFFSIISFSQENQFTDEEIEINKFVSGSLLVPPSEENVPLVIFIQGSGPTDRNGNNPQIQNNSLKMLAQGLAKNNIASFRYDKRTSKHKELGLNLEKFRFDDLVTDAVSVLDYFEEQEKYGKIIILGHSQGSLVGMLAAKNKTDAFISVSGPAQPIDSILNNQIAEKMPTLEENIRNSFKEMRKIDSTTNYHPFLASIFRPSGQTFLLS